MAKEPTPTPEIPAEAAAPPTYSSDQLALAVAEGKIATLRDVAAKVNAVLDKANINSLDHGIVKMAFQQAAQVAEADGRAAIERMNPPDAQAEETAIAGEAAEVEPSNPDLAPAAVAGPA